MTIKDKHGNVIEDGVPFLHKHSVVMPAIQAVTYTEGEVRYIYWADNVTHPLHDFWLISSDENDAEILDDEVEASSAIKEKLSELQNKP